MSFRALHVYTGKGYGIATSTMLNKIYNRGMQQFVIHLGDTTVRLDYRQSQANRTAIITQSINDLENFLKEWQNSNLATKKMYVAVPFLNDDTTTFTDADKLYSDFLNFMNQTKNAIVNRLGQDYWDKKFAGFYFRTEGIFPIQEKISSTNPTGNPMVKLMNDLSYRIHNTYDKEFIWCPYYGYGSNKENIIHNLGVIANRTNIFDIICIQPAYYFQGSAYKVNLDLIYDSIVDQEVLDLNGNPVAGGRRSSATAKIGVNMEADNDFNGSKADRFNAYVTTFASFPYKEPVIFYAGSTQNLTGNTSLLNAIEDFMK